MKVLYIEDDPVAREYVQKGLRGRGFVVDLAETAGEGYERGLSGEYDALIVDVMLPDGEGFDLVQRLRKGGANTPILFLSARGDVEDRVRGLRTGGDDYLPKPFAFSELVARTRAIARRQLDEPADGVRRIADLVVDVSAGKVFRAGEPIELPPKQFALLKLLVQHAGHVVTRERILEKVWGFDADIRSNALSVQVNYLRKAVDQGFDSKLIHTKPGVGYVLEDRGHTPPRT